MRFIKTSNSFVEFVEADGNGNIITSRGFQLGSVYFQIKNGRVTFYLNDSDNPYTNDVWTTNIPLVIDDVEYSTPEAVTDALGAIMNSNMQEQIDELSEDLAAESARAEEAEQQLDDAIDDERDRAVSAETHLSDVITALSGTVATYDERVSQAEEDARQAYEHTEAEITRSTAKDAEHDTAISGLTTSVNNEIARALSAETSLHNEVLSEASRAQAAESALTDAINAEEAARETADGVISGAVDTLSTALSNEVQRAQNAESGLTNSINTVSGNVQSEIARATAMENALSGAIESLADSTTMGFDELDDAIDAEEARAISAETSLHNEIVAETNRAETAESDITASLNAEVTRATAKDAAHDAEISGLTTSLQNEITRATGAENSLRNDLNAEVSARTTADAAQLQRITALEVGKADANSVYTKSESDTLLAAKADKANAVATAEYVSQNKTINFKNISGTVLSTIDATPFVVDGMLDSVSIVNGNLVFVWNTDSGKQTVSIPLTDIFNPSNYYTTGQTDALLANKLNITDFNSYSGATNTTINSKLNTADFNTYSGVTKTAIDEKLAISDFNTYSGATDTLINSKASQSTVDTLSGDVENVKQEIVTISGDSYTKDEVDDAISSYTYDKQTIDQKISESGTFDPTQYYNKNATDALLANKLDVSDFNTYSGNVNTTLNSKAEQSDLTATYSALTSHTSNSDIHVTASEKQTWNNKSDFSGSYNDLTDKPTIPTSASQLTNDAGYATQTWVGNQGYLVANDIANKADASALTSHTSDSTIHVTASEKQTWNNKSDFSGSYNDLTDKLSAGTNVTIVDNVISAASGGGGKPVEAGRGISVTTGVTSDTVSFNLPFYSNSDEDAMCISDSVVFTGKHGSNFICGTGHSIKGTDAGGKVNCNAVFGDNNIIENTQNFTDKAFSAAFGRFNYIKNSSYAFVGGSNNEVNNDYESAQGKYNVSNTGSTDADKTLFSLGNGTADNARHNAFEVRQNGDIYITSGNTDIKLQDHLGGGGGTSYSAGTGIDITSDVISVTGMTAESAFTAHTSDSTAHTTSAEKQTWNAKPNVWSGSEQQWAQISGGTLDNNTIYLIY